MAEWVRFPPDALWKASIDSQTETHLKLYIIIRADLPPGAQAAQACHGLMAFAQTHSIVANYWYAKSNNLVVLQVPSEACLKHLAARAEDAGIDHAVFREPDFDDTVTAVAIEPAGKRLVSNLPLALRTIKEAA